MTRAASVLLLVISVSAWLNAQQDDLVKLREEHEKAVAAAAKMLDDTYKLTLARIEKERAEQDDYEGALRVQERADMVGRKTPPAIPAARPGYVLNASQARTQGAIYDRVKGFLDFRKTGAAATWEILRLEPATYEVSVVYSVGTPIVDSSAVSAPAICGGSFSCKEVTSLGSSTIPLEKSVTTTGSWDNFVRASLGAWTFKSKSATVRLEAIAAFPGGLMRLARVELHSVNDVSHSPAASRKDAGELLRDLRREHRAVLIAALIPVQTKFRADFEKLEVELAQQGDSGGAAAVARERKRLFPDTGPPTEADVP